MSDASTKQTVECPICGEEFDPTVAGGWCTNTECGEWQHTDDADEAESEAESDGDHDASDVFAAPDDDEAESEADETPDQADDESADDWGIDDEADEDADAVEETETAGSVDADSSEVDEEPDAGVSDAADEQAPDDEAEEAEADETEADETEADEQADEAATIDCPDCGVELEAEANFCVECGADVADVTPGSDDSLDACPSCGVDVDDDDNFCVECGEDLDAHRAGDASEADTEQDSEAAEPDDAIDALGGDAVPESLRLEVNGTEIAVEDGDKVGREIRAALMDAGRPEEEAVRIHREHVRFVRESDGFYLVDLGDNPTALNGQSLTKGDREAVAPGDELELSGVTTVTVAAP